MAIVAEKRLYETPDGELVEELEDSGSLFCAVATELEGEAAKRYQAYVGGHKSAGKPEDKSMAKDEDKGAPSLENLTVVQLTDLAEQMELDVGRRPRKDDLVSAIEEAEAKQAEAAAAAAVELAEKG